MDYKKLFDLTGKVAIVTGGNGYLGTQNVKILKDFGATVVSLDRTNEKPKWSCEENVCDMFLQCDISLTESVAKCFETVFDKFGRIDILVNCAAFGAGYGKESQLEYMDDETFKRVLTEQFARHSVVFARLFHI